MSGCINNAKRKRIVVVASTFPRWEGDHEPPFVYELSKRLQEEFEILVLAPHASGAKRQDEMAGLKIYRFQYFFNRLQTLAYNGGILANLKKNKLNYLLIPFFVLFEFISLARLLRQVPVDVIHAHWLIPQGLIAIAACAVSPGNPSILCTSHGGDLFALRGSLLTWIKRQIIRRVDKMTVVSHAMAQYASEIAGRNDLEVISMGVDLQHRFTPSPIPSRNQNQILFVGRLVEKKGVEYLISAIELVQKKRPGVTLQIAGDGPEKARLQRLAADLGIEKYIEFLGTVNNSDLKEMYRRAAIFVCPSITAQNGDQEGLGLVLVEALGCECPVIASDLPAIRDVVIDGVTGLICKEKNSKDIASKILQLLDNPEYGKVMAQAARQHVLKNFDWTNVCQRYHKLIDEMHKQPT